MIPLHHIFEIKSSQSLELVYCDEDENGICFVSRTSENNGIAARIRKIDYLEPMPPNAITVALGGSVLSAFYQKECFYTAFHIASLYAKQPLTKELMLYYAAVIEKNKYRYNYGRQANRTLGDILVPDINEVPVFVSDISLDDYHLDQEPLLKKKYALHAENWKAFKYAELFDIKKGRRLTKADMLPGDINYIGAVDSNNGVTAKIANDEHLHEKNTITVSYNGSIAEAFYQSEPFWATDDVNVLYPKFDLNPFIALFLCTLIAEEKYRFNYGRKWDREAMLCSVVKLPAKEDGKPDWRFMENYVKSLPHSGCLE